MKLFLLIYAMIGWGCALRADDEDGPLLGRIFIFLLLIALWPTVVGSLLAKAVSK